jgi:hypothetical protein
MNRRAVILIAVIAIFAAVLLLLIPQGHASRTAPWLAFLPVFFVGLLASFSAPCPRAAFDRIRVLSAPFRLSRFQRPPPFLLG